MSRTLGIFIIVAFCALLPSLVGATDYSSPSFILRDPVINTGAGFSSSGSFGHFGSDGQTVTGQQTSGSFIGRSGFLYFPFVSSPVLTGVAGDEEADLSWTAATADLGFTVSGYDVGQGTVSGGPYTYTSVGNVLATTVTGLTNGQTYYFIVRAIDALGDPIATSSQVSVTPQVAGDDDDDGGGGGRGDTRQTPLGGFIVRGYAHPRGVVYILRDGVRVDEISVPASGIFELTEENISEGSYIVSMYGTDREGVRSGLISFPITLTSGEDPVVLDGIFLPPTIEFMSGSPVRVGGSTMPGAAVGILSFKEGAETLVETVVAGENGHYEAPLRDDVAADPLRLFKSIAVLRDLRSPFSISIAPADFLVRPVTSRGDFNADERVNIIDFSILAYWHNRPNPPPRFDLNSDGVITLVDFSILTFYWTG